MKDPNTIEFQDKGAKEIIEALHKYALPAASSLRQYRGFTSAVMVIADYFPADKKAILSLLDAKPEKSSAPTSTPTKVVAPANWIKAPDNQKKTAPSVELEIIPKTTKADKEVKLPAEIFADPPQAPKKFEAKDKTFLDGNTPDEVLLAHGYGVVEDGEVKDRLLATLAMLKGEHDKRWGMEKLAKAVLDAKKEQK